jgi:hypothetical protein
MIFNTINIYNEIIKQLLDDYQSPYFYDEMSLFVPCEIIEASPTKPWNFVLLSFNKNITMDLIRKNLDKPWSYDILAIYGDISDDEISSNPQLFGNHTHNMRTVEHRVDNYIQIQKNKTRLYEKYNRYIRRLFQEWFKKSALKEELIAKLWHPNNFEKFKYYDPETFAEVS